MRVHQVSADLRFHSPSEQSSPVDEICLEVCYAWTRVPSSGRKGTIQFGPQNEEEIPAAPFLFKDQRLFSQACYGQMVVCMRLLILFLLEFLHAPQALQSIWFAFPSHAN